MPIPIVVRIKAIQKTLKVSQTGIFDLPTCIALEAVMSVTVPSNTSLDDHKRAIQRALGFTGKDVDALVGPGTLSRIEHFFSNVLPPLPAGATMIVSKKSLDLIVNAEVSSKAAYQSKFKFPTWPGGDSGVTIGIGYDLGYNTIAKITSDWGEFISGDEMNVLHSVAGLKADKARAALSPMIKSIEVPWEAALNVFYTRSMPAFAKQTAAIYPGVEKLPPDAQGALVSLVYNRGNSLNGDRRLEMRNIVPLVAAGDLNGIAKQIRNMKRLWDPNKLKGLIIRREDEAVLVENANFFLSPNEYIFI
jgi:hypothetical protein